MHISKPFSQFCQPFLNLPTTIKTYKYLCNMCFVRGAGLGGGGMVGGGGGGEKENEDLYDHKMFCRIDIPLNSSCGEIQMEFQNTIT